MNSQFSHFTKPGRATSRLWDYFGVYKDGQKPDVFVCFSCLSESPNKAERQYPKDKSTSALSSHLRTHPILWKEYQKNQQDARTSSSESETKIIRTRIIPKFVRWIAKRNKPLSTCEEPEFYDLLAEINPTLNLTKIRRREVTDEITRMSEVAKSFIHTKIEDQDISITADHWTSGKYHKVFMTIVSILSIIFHCSFQPIIHFDNGTLHRQGLESPRHNSELSRKQRTQSRGYQRSTGEKHGRIQY